MTKKNYAAWKINTDNLSLDNNNPLKTFCEFAILAPSGHNTQPWLFKFYDKSVELTVNHNRELPHSGKVAAEPFVSIGSCIETMVLAAEGFGYKLDIQMIYKPNFKAVIKISSKTKTNKKMLLAIKNRVSNREPYKLKIENEDIVQSFLKNSFGIVKNTFVTDKKDIEYLAEKTSKATINIMRDKEFRLELSKWVRNNLTKQYDGMPAFVQGMPTPPSLVAKHVIKNIDISKSQAKKDAARVIKSGGIVILELSKITNESFVDLGREYARICIIAQLNGLATSGVGAAAIDGESKTDIKKRFKLNGTPSAMIRIGSPIKEVRHAPRLPLEMVTLD